MKKTTDIMINLISFFCITLILIFFQYSYQNYKLVNKKIVHLDNSVNSAFLKVRDVYGQKNQISTSEFFKSEHSLEGMKRLNEYLNNNFNYMEFQRQGLFLISQDFIYKNQFRKDFGTPIYGANDDIGITLKSSQVGVKTYKDLDMDTLIIDGMGFSDNDYILNSSSNTIPALAGFNYKDYVNVGDKIKFEYLSKIFEIKIIGILDKNSSIILNNNIHLFDDDIVIPSLSIPENPTTSEDDVFQKILYSTKNWGWIKVNEGENVLEYEEAIQAKSSELNLQYIVDEAYASNYIVNISNSINSIKGLLFIFSLFVLVLSALTLLYISIWKYKKKKHIYAIYLVSGYSFSKLKLRILSSIFIEFIGAFAVSTYCNSLFTNNSIDDVNTSIMTFFIVVILSMIVSIALNFYINKNEISLILRDNQ